MNIIEKLEGLQTYRARNDGRMVPAISKESRSRYINADDLRAIIEEYKNAQEPVAWIYQRGNVRNLSFSPPSSYDKNELSELEVGVTRLFTHPPLSDETVKDAERYAWLRKNVADPESKWCVYEVSADQYPDLDGAIDKAMIDEAMKVDNAETKGA